MAANAIVQDEQGLMVELPNRNNSHATLLAEPRLN